MLHPYWRAALIAASLALGVVPAAQAQVTTATPTEYDVTLQKLEFCDDAACSSPLEMGTTILPFDVAAPDAGEIAGNYPVNDVLTQGDTFTHLRITLSRTFQLTGSTTAPVPGVGAHCRTDENDTTASTIDAGIAAQEANATDAETNATKQALVAPSITNNYTPAAVDLATKYPELGISFPDTTTMTIIQPFKTSPGGGGGGGGRPRSTSAPRPRPSTYSSTCRAFCNSRKIPASPVGARSSFCRPK